MKNFFKKLAFVLALAMVVTAVAPAAKASAAKTPALNTTGKKLYIGGDKTGEYSNKFTLKVWNKGDYSVTFKSDNAEIATVTKWYGVVEAKAVGTATITATVTNKTTKKVVKTLSAKVYVKKNADSVAFGSLKAFDEALTIGQTQKINVKRVVGSVDVWKQADKSVTTDYIVWKSSNTEVATVSKWGTVKAVGAGEATITATAYQTEGKVATTDPASVKINVAAAEGIKEVVQISQNTATIYFNGTPEVNKDTLVIKDSYGQEFTFADISYNADNKAAEVKTIVDFTDGMVYTVSIKGVDKTYEFKASVGSVASIKITGPNQVIANENTKLEYAVYDANGKDVTSSSKNIGTVDFAIDSASTDNAYITDSEVYFYEVGKSATITVTYHTNTYDENNEEILFKDTRKFVALDPNAVQLNYANISYKIADAGKADVDFADSTIGMKISTTADYPTVHIGDNKQIFAMLLVNNLYYSNDVNHNTKDLKDNAVGSLKFESLDEAKVQISEDGVLTPSSTGVAKIKITSDYNDRSVIVPIMILADPYPVSYTLVKDYTGNISNVTSVTVDAKEYEQQAVFKATIKDQNGNEIKLADANYSVVPTNDLAKDVSVSYAVDKNTLTFTTNGVDVGTYKYDVYISGAKSDGTAVTIYRTITFNVVEAGTPTDKFQVEADTSKDIKKYEQTNVAYKLVRLDSKGLKYSYVDADEYLLRVKSPNGVTVNIATGSAVTSFEEAAIKDSQGIYVLNDNAKVGYVVATDINGNTKYGAQGSVVGGYLALNLVNVSSNVATKAKTGTYSVAVYAKPGAYEGTTMSEDKLIISKSLAVTNTADVPKVSVTSTAYKPVSAATGSGIVTAINEKISGTFNKNLGYFNNITSSDSKVKLEGVIFTDNVAETANSIKYNFTRLVITETDGTVTYNHVVVFNKTITFRTK